jgi:uncharacterized protein
MQFNQDLNFRAYMIRSYAPGELSITHPIGNTAVQGTVVEAKPRHEVVKHNLIIMADQIIRDWGPSNFRDLDQTHFDIFSTLDIEVVLLGAGETQQFLKQDLMDTLLKQGIGVEVMNNAAACRTYNIIMTEGRRVAAALIIG